MSHFLKLFVLLVSWSFFAQKPFEVKPFTIETTYQKLKNDYPFISPIQNLVSDEYAANLDIVYKTTETSDLKLDVFYPKNDQNQIFPAVLLIHGGGWLSGSKDNLKIMAQHLASKGFVAITVAYRLGLEAKYPAAVLDIKEALIWTKVNADKFSINPDKIGIIGASAGGQLATLVGVTAQNKIFEIGNAASTNVQCIVNIDGIVSFVHPEAAAEGTMASIWLNGSKTENFKNWNEASPLNYVDKNCPPILFVNSSMPRFHAGRDDMMAKLNALGVFNQTFTIPETPHAFWLMQPWFETTLEFIVPFLNKTLKNNTIE